MGNDEVVAIIAQIIRYFDIIAIQEIRDASGDAIVVLKNAVNAGSAVYDCELGPREGRTTVQEQYAFFFNTATIESLDSQYIFDEGGTDTFEREPFIVKFRAKGKPFDFCLVNIHTDPDFAPQEISRLPEVMADARTRTAETDVICLGDFNADNKSYTHFDESVYSSIFPADTYLWMIDNTQDTTVGSGSWTYDRIVAYAASDEDFTDSAGVYRYDQVLSMGLVTPGDLSDHYPVEAVFWTGRDTD